MAYLIDTSILVRLANTTDPEHALATTAIVELHRRGESLQIAPQNLIEFRNVATRPTQVNGLGFTPDEADIQSTDFEMTFSLLDESPDIFLAWKQIVQRLAIIGKQVHDARLVAICQVHGLSHVLTFNSGHFQRLATATPGLIIVEPRNV